MLARKRGFGRGRGGPRQGLGPPKACVCPSCGRRYKKIVGVPCVKQTCTYCKVPLIGAD